MSKTYAAPTIVAKDSVVSATRNGDDKVIVESLPANTRPSSAGSVGFGL